eukprot:COSAG02_NODE_1016_length_15190_cov_128.667418_8_plen_393_part_00
MYSARRVSPRDHDVASPTTVLNQFLEQEDAVPYRTAFSPAHGGGGGVPRYEERPEDSDIKQALQAEYERRCHEMMKRAEATRGESVDEMSDLIVGGDTAAYLNLLSKARRPVSEHTARRSNNRCDPQPTANRFGDRLAEELLTPRSSADELRTQLERAIRQRDEAQHNAAKATALLKHQTELAAQKLSKVEDERDEAIMQLVLSQEDVHALRAQMEDAALYIASLKQRNAQMEMAALSALHQRDEATAEAAYYEQGAEAAFEYAAKAARSVNSDTSGDDGVFSTTNIKRSIEKAVQDMAALPEEEQRKKIKQLRLRWHPDKNPVLGEFAAEVTKIINDCVENLKSSSATSQGAATAGCEEVVPRASGERQDGTKGPTDESVGVGRVLTIRNT